MNEPLLRFLELVDNMRMAQRSYFQCIAKAKKSKAYEAEVDLQLPKLLTHEKH